MVVPRQTEINCKTESELWELKLNLIFEQFKGKRVEFSSKENTISQQINKISKH